MRLSLDSIHLPPEYLPSGGPAFDPVPSRSQAFLDFLSSWETLDRSTQSGKRPSYLVRLHQDRKEGGFDISQSLRNLSSEEKTELKELVGKKSYGHWLALSGESDPNRFYSRVLSLGIRYQDRGDMEKAQEIYQLLSDPPEKLKVPEAIQKEAGREMGAMVGYGEAGARFEFLLSRLVAEATDWKMIVPMIAGATVFQMAKAATLGHWASRGIRSWYTRGKMAEFSAGVVGFVPEVATFTGLGRTFRKISTEEIPGEEMPLGKELMASTTTLGALKIFSFLGRQFVAKFYVGNPLAQFLVPQAAIFGGLLSAHKFEEEVGLRQPVDGATLVMDTLGAVVSLGVGSHLGYKMLGPRMVRFQKELAIKTKVWARQLKEMPNTLLPSIPSMAVAGGPPGMAINMMGTEWGEGPLGGGEPPKAYEPPPVTPPRLPEFVGHRTNSLTRSVEAAVRYVPPECKCLFIDVAGARIPEMEATLTRLLRRKTHLEEIRLKFLDGKVTYATRKWGHIRVKTIELSAQDPIFNGTDRPPEEVLRFHVFTPWVAEKQEGALGHEWFRNLREVQNLSREEVVARLMDPADPRREWELQHYFGANKTVSEFTFEKLENPSRISGIAFPFLKRLAQAYRTDVRRLIAVMNRRRFPQVPQDFWSTKDYPIYLEDKLDLQRIRLYQDGGEQRGIGSFGWMIWSLRKNPFHYFTTGDLADALGVDLETVARWEINGGPPINAAKMLPRLAEVLRVPENRLTTALNRTYQIIPTNGARDSTGMEVQQQWLEFLRSRIKRTQEPLPLPEVVNHQSMHLMRAIEATVRYVTPNIKCVFIEVVGDVLHKLDKKIVSLLESKPSLEEIRIRFIDGKVLWAARVEGEIVRQGREYRWVPWETERVVSELEAMAADNPIYRGVDRPPEEIFRVRLMTPWQKRGNEMPERGNVLRNLREASEFSPEQVYERLANDPEVTDPLKRSYRNKVVNLSSLRNWEDPKVKTAIPFPILHGLAKIFQVDVRKLILSSNQSRHQDIPEVFWSTRSFPIYIGGPEDLQRIHTYMKAPPEKSVGSLGWLLWSLRKDPYRYMTVGDFSRATGYGEEVIREWETNQVYPELEAFQVISRVLGISENHLLEVANRTYYPEQTTAIFPNLPLYLHKWDVPKIQVFSMNPGTLGQWLFAVRKLSPGCPSCEEMNSRLGRHNRFFHDREHNDILVGTHNLQDWVELFRSLDIPLELLKATVEEHYGIPRDDPAYFLAEMAKGRTLEQLSEEIGVGINIVQDLSSGRLRSVTPPVILQLREGLPDGDWGSIYRNRYPRVVEAFPEAATERPFLFISPQILETELPNLNLAERLFAFRMNPPMDLPGIRYRKDGTLDLNPAAEALDISPNVWRNHEQRFNIVRDDADLIKLADGLGIDRRLLYLYYRPEVLRIFELRDPETKIPWELDHKDGAQLMARLNKNYSRQNKRRKLGPVVGRLLRESGERNPVNVLSQALGIRSSAAKKYLDGGRFLNPAEIAQLTDFFEGLSYSEWYEQFNRGPLNFFLGRTPSGQFDYRLGGNRTWQELDQWDLPELARARLPERPFRDPVGKEMRRQIKFLREGRTTLNFLTLIGRETGIPVRDLYLWSRRHELRPMIEAANPSP